MFVLWLSVSMDAHSVVDDWDTVPFDGGFAGLDELAARGFSGAVEADGTWLFFRDGEALAVVSDLESVPRSGDLDAFEKAVGTKHTAPASSVATLAAMLALDGDVRGRYYTDDTPLKAVDETLTGGGFTGYVELSENVLSGDYYFVYVDGEVEHVGFVGSSQLFTGEEAETKAKDEVGIYAVTAVSLPRPELPEPPEPPEPEPSPADTQPPSGSAETDQGAEPNVPADTDGSESQSPATESGSRTTSEPTPDPDSTSPSDPDRSGADPDSQPTQLSADSDAETDSAAREQPDDDPAVGPENSPSDPDGSPGDRSGVTDRETASEASDDDALASDSDDAAESATSEADSRSERRHSTGGGIEAVTTRTVPSLDPENSGRVTSEATSQTTQSGATQGRSSGSDRRAVQDSSQEATQSQTAEQTEQLREEYESALEARESKIETYESRIADLESELAGSESRIEALEAELDSLRDERDELRSRLGSADTARETSLSPADALSQTSLFIRTIDRGDATLEAAHAGTADREAVNENLQIEYHTEFEDSDVTVEGEPFETWLRSSDAHAFVEWLVTDLFFEIRSTGATEGLRPLYDALPGIDRVGFEETIRVGDGTEGRETGFDIVARNKKGTPVVVVAFDRQRDPTRADSIEPFVTDASDVCAEYESLAAAVAITSSYFESDARAAVEEVTSTSLLSRSKHRSYVKLSRTAGYHFCLAEFRDGSFNLTHPEL
jgi:hypothetical protein